MNPSVTPLTIDILPEVVSDDDSLSHLRVGERAESTFPNVFNRKTGALASVAIAAVAGSSLLPTGNSPAQYEGKLQLLVEPDAGDTTRQPNQAATPTQPKISAPSIDYATQIQVLWSPKVLSPVVEQLKQQYPDISYDSIKQNLDITHSTGTKTLEVSYRDTDPKKTQAVLEQVSQAYLKYSQECRTSLCRELKFIESRLPHLKRQTALAQRTLQAFQQQHGFTNPDISGKQLSDRSNGLVQQTQALQIQLTEARTQYTIAQKRLAANDAQITQLLNQNSRYQSLMAQFQTTANQLATELGQAQPNTVMLQSLKQQYQDLSTQLTQVAQQPVIDRLSQATANPETINYDQVAQLETLKDWVTAANQISMLEASGQAIEQAEILLNGQIKQWVGLTRQYDELQLELKFATDNLALYQQKQKQLQTIIHPDLTWQVKAPPTVETTSTSGSTISDSQRDFSLAVVLCFLIVVWVMSLGGEPKQSRPLIYLLRPDDQPDQAWQPGAWMQPATTPVLHPVLVESEVPRSHPSPSLAFLLLKTAVYAQARQTKEVSIYTNQAG